MYILREHPASLPPTLIQRYRAISPSAIGHHISSGAMENGIHPLQNGVTLLGQAVTVKTVGRDSLGCHKVVDIIQPGDVIVVERDGDLIYACWGEMTTLAARLAGAAGVVVDGPVTDVQLLRKDPLPIFCRGAAVITTQFLGTQGGINIPIVCGGTVVNPGDLIFGDDNGVLVIPANQAEQLLELASQEEKEDAEWREGLLAGKHPSEMAPIDAMMKLIKENTPPAT
jgi:4-hydroxy-4-methyl-2-oxoglutarate aldolase